MKKQIIIILHHLELQQPQHIAVIKSEKVSCTIKITAAYGCHAAIHTQSIKLRRTPHACNATGRCGEGERMLLP